MRIIAFVNSRVAAECISWLRECGDDIVGMVIHPEERRRCGSELIAAAAAPDNAIFLGDRLREPETLEAIASLRPEIGVSIFFGHILRPPLIELFPRGVVNLHPALLPYNRGQYPNVWSIVDRTPSGVTLHYIDPGIDTGDIISQREVQSAVEDTGETLYRRLETACVGLFRDTWPLLRAGRASRRPQAPDAGTSHRARDVEGIDEIDIEREYRAGDLIDILRARTFPPYPGAYFLDGNRKIYMRLELLPEDQVSKRDE